MRSPGNAAFCAFFGLVWLAAAAGEACGHVAVHPSCAYIDPGTGSFMIQLLIGGLLGSLFVVKMFWRQITGFVRGLFGRKPDRTATEPQAESESDANPQEGARDG